MGKKGRRRCELTASKVTLMVCGNFGDASGMVSGAEESRRKSDKLAEERIGDYSGLCCTRHREDDDE